VNTVRLHTKADIAKAQDLSKELSSDVKTLLDSYINKNQKILEKSEAEGRIDRSF
jgi:hypothetical protein